MSYNRVNPYSVDQHIAELYDQQENYTDDVTLLLDLIGNRRPLAIFEPFCGTGRILIPLARAGHTLTGLDQSDVLLKRCKDNLRCEGVQATLIERDAIGSEWPGGFDVVVMGGNCLYELANAEEQAGCIRAAAGALKPGGTVFVDNDHMEGELSESWQDTGIKTSFPTGTCADGIRLESTMQTVWFDAQARLARFERKIRTIFPDGEIEERNYMQQKHPPSMGEVKGWLEESGFEIERLYGNRAGEAYEESSERAIFWARKKMGKGS